MLIRLSYIFILLCYCQGFSLAQKAIVLAGQPNEQKAIDIAESCEYFLENADKPLSFEEAKKQRFEVFRPEFRKQKFSSKPLIIQWIRFKVQNTSMNDSLDLHLATVHVFTRLYDEDKLIKKGGAYEQVPKSNKVTAPINTSLLPIKVAPNSTKSYWLRTEDRQNELVPPIIKLQTPAFSYLFSVKDVFEARYLFLILAAMTGCFFFLGIYAAYHYYLYHNASFFWYILYTIGAFFSGLHWMDIRLGLAMFSPLIHDIIFSVFLWLIPVLYSNFIVSMLDFPVHFKKGWLFVKILLTIVLFQMLWQFIEVRCNCLPFPNIYGYLLSPISIIVLNIVLAILVAKSKSPVKWFLFAGPISILILWCMPVLNLYAPSEQMNRELFLVINFPIVFLLLGLLIEGICFSFALTYQSKLVFIEKNKIQENYNLQLEQDLDKRTQQLEIKNKQIEAEKIKQIELAYEKKIAETEMTALRAQMNPHFIFNSLNSINLYTLENDTESASEYLSKFSQLIRLVLENSKNSTITLKKELETLELYIQLEAMRFKEKVKYSIKLAPEIDIQYIEIPPLLLQPYVENAIWHGLMHKNEGGNIEITITQPDEFLLHIEITDDGIGREKAQEYKSKSATKHKSYGLKMTSDRIAAINHIYKNNTNVQIIDLKNENNLPLGTKVVIEIQL